MNKQEKIISSSFATDEKIIELFSICSSVINTRLKKPVNFICILSDEEELKINIEKTPYVSEFFDHFTIKITRDIIKYICDLFYIVLSDNSIFPGVGKSQHIINIPTLHVPSWQILDLAMQNVELPFFDDERRRLHKYLFSIATEFIMFHEAVHVLNGHVSYLYDREKRIVAEQQVQPFTPLDCQTLEYDADCVATAMFAHYLLKNNETSKKMREQQMCLYYFIFAISIVLVGMPGQLLETIDNLSNKKHLSSSFRVHFFWVTMENISRFADPLFETTDLKKLINDLLNNFIKLEGNKIFPMGILDELSNINDEHIKAHRNEIIQNWFDKWFYNLQPFAYIKLVK